MRHPLRIGGPGHVVEIDESAFVWRKHNVGRVVNTQWVFGGLDMEPKDGFLVAVDRRNADTLLPVLQEYVITGSTIVSDFMGRIWNSKQLRVSTLDCQPSATLC